MFTADRKFLGQDRKIMDIRIGPQLQGPPVVFCSISFKDKFIFGMAGNEDLFQDGIKGYESFIQGVKHEIECFAKIKNLEK
jgi:hypothetical protein